jgi:hypothetical protein
MLAEGPLNLLCFPVIFVANIWNEREFPIIDKDELSLQLKTLNTKHQKNPIQQPIKKVRPPIALEFLRLGCPILC